MARFPRNMAPVVWSILALCVVGRISAFPLDAWLNRQHGDITRFLQQYRDLNPPDADNDVDGPLVEVVDFESQSQVDDTVPHKGEYQIVADPVQDSGETTDEAKPVAQTDSTDDEALSTLQGSEGTTVGIDHRSQTDLLQDAEETTSTVQGFDETTADVDRDADSLTTQQQDSTTADGSEHWVRVTDDQDDPAVTTDAVTLDGLVHFEDLLTTDTARDVAQVEQDAVTITDTATMESLAEIQDDSATTADSIPDRNQALDDSSTTSDSVTRQDPDTEDSQTTTDSVQKDSTDSFSLGNLQKDTTDVITDRNFALGDQDSLTTSDSLTETTDLFKSLGQDSTDSVTDSQDSTASTVWNDRDLATEDDSLTTADSVTFRMVANQDDSTTDSVTFKDFGGDSTTDSLADILAKFQLPASIDSVEDDALTTVTDGNVEDSTGIKVIADETTTDGGQESTDAVAVTAAISQEESTPSSSEPATESATSVTDFDLESITIEIAGPTEEESLASSVSKVQAAGEEPCARSTSIDSKCHASTQQIDPTDPSATTATIQTDDVMTDESTSRDLPDTTSANDSTTPDAAQ